MGVIASDSFNRLIYVNSLILDNYLDIWIGWRGNAILGFSLGNKLLSNHFLTQSLKKYFFFNLKNKNYDSCD